MADIFRVFIADRIDTTQTFRHGKPPETPLEGRFLLIIIITKTPRGVELPKAH